MTLTKGRSSHTNVSAVSARSGRAESYCHSVVHESARTKERTSARNSGRGLHSGPWKSASISVCGPPVMAAIRQARVVFPTPDTPATSTRFGECGSGSL